MQILKRLQRLFALICLFLALSPSYGQLITGQALDARKSSIESAVENAKMRLELSGKSRPGQEVQFNEIASLLNFGGINPKSLEELSITTAQGERWRIKSLGTFASEGGKPGPIVWERIMKENGK